MKIYRAQLVRVSLIGRKGFSMGRKRSKIDQATTANVSVHKGNEIALLLF
jgi:hypothetical protein